MVVSAPPLITRLRRRIAATAWLFAFVVLAKAAVSTACMGEGTAESVATAGVVDSVTALLESASDSDDNCFHAGSTGCHCACAHGAVLAVDATTIIPSLLESIPLPSISSLALLAPRSTTLRPPIV